MDIHILQGNIQKALLNLLPQVQYVPMHVGLDTELYHGAVMRLFRQQGDPVCLRVELIEISGTASIPLLGGLGAVRFLRKHVDILSNYESQIDQDMQAYIDCMSISINIHDPRRKQIHSQALAYLGAAMGMPAQFAAWIIKLNSGEFHPGQVDYAMYAVQTIMEQHPDMYVRLQLAKALASI